MSATQSATVCKAVSYPQPLISCPQTSEVFSEKVSEWCVAEMGWNPKASMARALPSVPSCHEQMWKMQWDSLHRLQEEASFLLRPIVPWTEPVDLQKIMSLLCVSLVSQMGLERRKQVMFPPLVPVCPLAQIGFSNLFLFREMRSRK